MSPRGVGDRLTRAGTALAVASLALTVDNLRRLRRPPEHPAPSREVVSVLLPARDEAGHIDACLAALRAAADAAGGPGTPSRLEILVLDDGSADDTAARVAAVAAVDPRVRLLSGSPTPPGWIAKPWACHELAAAARPDAGVLVFLDADVVLAPDALVAATDLLRTSGLDLVSPHPRQEADGAVERLVQPLLAWSWLSMLPLRFAEHSPWPSMSAANGQFVVVDAGVYRRSGGHGAARSAVLDDLALLRAVKHAGGSGGVVDGTRLARCRMYVGGRAVRAGYTKSLWAAFGPAPAAVGVVGVLVLAHVVPAVAALTGSRTGLVGYAASVAARALAARRTGGRVGDTPAHPASVVVFGLLTADSFRSHRRGVLRWRGRPVEPAARAA